MRKLCWLCKHIEYDDGCPDYSAVTPGEPCTLGCTKGKWDIEAHGGDTTSSVRRLLLNAETCSDFEEAKV